MTQYNNLNVKLSNSQLNKSKSAIKNESELVLTLSRNMICESNDKFNFPHKLLLTNRRVLNIRKAFANNSSVDIKFSKTQLSKMVQLGGFLGRLLGPLLKKGLPLIKSVIKPLAKIVLISFELTAAASAADAGIHKKILGSGRPLDLASRKTALIISNDETDDFIKIVKSLEQNGLLIKGVTESVQNKIKEQKCRFLSMLLGRLGASLLENIKASYVRPSFSALQNNKMDFLMSPHPLTNFEIQKYYENKHKFNDVYSRDNLPNKIKDRAYVINLDEY